MTLIARKLTASWGATRRTRSRILHTNTDITYYMYAVYHQNLIRLVVVSHNSYAHEC